MDRLCSGGRLSASPSNWSNFSQILAKLLTNLAAINVPVHNGRHLIYPLDFAGNLKTFTLRYLTCRHVISQNRGIHKSYVFTKSNENNSS